MDITTAQTLARGQELHRGDCTRTVGPRGGVTVSQFRVRVTSLKKWVTRPGEVVVGVKYGLYVSGKLDARDLAGWHTAADCPLLHREGVDKR
jgi:hypothetical protein